MRFTLRVFSLLFISCFIGCEDTNTLKQNMNGIWEIEELNFNDQDYLGKLYLNVITFSENSMTIPSTHDYNGEENTQWEIVRYNKVDSLIIKSHNKIFEGRYKLLFAEDPEDNSVYAKLISKETFIVIHKADLGIPPLGNSMFVN